MSSSPISRFGRVSLKARVALSATALLTLALVVAALALSGLEQRSLLQEVDVLLNDRIAGIADNYAKSTAQPEIVLTGRESGVVQIVQGNRVIAATPGLLDKPQLVITTPTLVTTYQTSRRAVGEPDVDRWRIATRRIQKPDGPVDIYAASSLESVDLASTRLRTTMFSGIPFLVLAFSLISWFATKWSLDPVDKLRRTVDTMSPTDTDMGRHLSEPNTNDEVASLVRTVNTLLTKVAEARKRERRFAADASHELRTPLSTARLNLEIAQANPTIENLTFAVNETLTEVGRLETLARDLLEMTRLDRDRVRVASVPIDIAAMVREELTAAERRRTDLTHRVTAEGDTNTNAVPGLVLRVVRNLVENAQRHAMSLVDVSVIQSSDIVIVTVYNDGDPIAPADRARIFDPFTRLDDARARDDGGTGLGLAIAADIIEAHGGTIAVIDDSQGRHGASFSFTVPLDRNLISSSA